MKASTSSRVQGGSEASLRKRAAESEARAMASSAIFALGVGGFGGLRGTVVVVLLFVAFGVVGRFTAPLCGVFDAGVFDGL